jgi:hypothetical protein
VMTTLQHQDIILVMCLMTSTRWQRTQCCTTSCTTQKSTVSRIWMMPFLSLKSTKRWRGIGYESSNLSLVYFVRTAVVLTLTVPSWYGSPNDTLMANLFCQEWMRTTALWLGQIKLWILAGN